MKEEAVDEVTGACHCGQVSYSVLGEKQFEFFCYCTDCRKLNGGGHLAGIAIAHNNISLRGDPAEYCYPGGSGKMIQLVFCSRCSTQILAFPSSHPDVVILRANTLDRPQQFEPQKSIYTDTAFEWDRSEIKEKSV